METENSTSPSPVESHEGDQVMQEAMDHRAQAMADIERARQNIAEGKNVHVADAHDLILTPREAQDAVNGQTDANK